jgi:hypothetical protein
MMPSVGGDCHPRMHGPRSAFGRSGDAEWHPCYSLPPMARIRLVVALFGFASAVAQGPVEPAFATGDLATLDCRLVAIQAVEDGVQRLTVEVHNRGTVAAEPLAFRIELPQKKPQPPAVATFVRAQLPHAARHGRPAPAGGKQTYVLSTWLAGKKGQLSVHVTAAAFGSDLAVPKPAIAFGKPEQVQRESMAGTFPVTKVTVTNPLPREVDVLVLVTYEQPKDVIELVGLRLPAQGTRDVVIATRPGNEVFLDPLMEMPGCAIKAVAFEVVDWCLVGAVPKDAGVALLREAYEGWYRWPEAEATVAGDFTFRERSRRGAGEDGFEDFVVKGRFTLRRTARCRSRWSRARAPTRRSCCATRWPTSAGPTSHELGQRNRLVQVAANASRSSAPAGT